MGLPLHNESKNPRPVFVATNSSYYGAIDSAIIEFQGSPPRSTVFVSGIQNVICRTIVVAGIDLKPYSKKFRAVDRLVRIFLTAYLIGEKPLSGSKLSYEICLK